MATAFVTGGTGFVGSHLVEALLDSGYTEVRCLVRKEARWLEGLPVTLVRGDLEDADALAQGVAGVDYVYHVAGLTRAQDEAAFERANVTGTLRLLDAVAQHSPTVRKVLVTSSLAAVGTCAAAVADESARLQPISRYGASKARMERALAGGSPEGIDHLARLPIVVVRPPAVYGPREADIYTFFQTFQKGLCPVIGDPDMPDLSLVHVRDLVRGMIQAAEASNTAGKTYFLGSARPYTWREIRAATAAAFGRDAVMLRVPKALVGTIGAVAEWGGRLLGQYPPLNREKAREIRDACKMCTSARAATDFDYAPNTPLDAGFRETIGWYRQAGWL